MNLTAKEILELSQLIQDKICFYLDISFKNQNENEHQHEYCKEKIFGLKKVQDKLMMEVDKI